jgi:hypothetical protein
MRVTWIQAVNDHTSEAVHERLERELETIHAMIVAISTACGSRCVPIARRCWTTRECGWIAANSETKNLPA